MKILCSKTERIAHPMPYLPQMLLLKGRTYDTDKGEIVECIAHRAVQLGIAAIEKDEDVSNVETPDDNPALDIHNAFIARDEDLDDEDLGDEDLDDEDNSKVEEAPEAEETTEAEEPKAEKPPTAKKIIRRKN